MAGQQTIPNAVAQDNNHCIICHSFADQRFRRGSAVWFFCCTWQQQRSAGDNSGAGDSSKGLESFGVGGHAGVTERWAQVQWSNGVPTHVSSLAGSERSDTFHGGSQFPQGTLMKARQKPHSCSSPADRHKSWDGIWGAFHSSRTSLSPVQIQGKRTKILNRTA